MNERDATADRRNAKPRRLGFTLVEVVISISITAVLMVALWSLLTMYLNVSIRSERQTTRVQLVRSIHRQIENDLRQVYFRPSGGKQNLRAFEAAPAGVFDASGDSFSTTPDGDTLDSRLSDGDAPSFSSSFDDVELTQDALSVDGDVIYDLTNDLWSKPNLSLKGNSFGLIIDHPFRAEPSRELKPLEQESDDIQGPTPPNEFLARTVYVFVDRAESLTKGFPPGLLRVTFLPKELERIRNDATGDLFQILEQAKPGLFKKTEYTDAWHDDESTVQDARMAALDELNRSLGRVRLMEHDFVNRIDYLPEVHSFRLRFFDGESWTDGWDVDSQKRMPVIVELSFEIDMDRRTKIDEDFARITEDFTFEDLQAEEIDTSEIMASEVDAMSLDSEIRSAQTAAYVPPNQFLIFLGTSGPALDRHETSETTDAEGADEPTDSSSEEPEGAI